MTMNLKNQVKTLEEFLQNEAPQLKIERRTVRELTWKDLPYEINDKKKFQKFLNFVKQDQALYKRYGPMIEIIENGTKPFYKQIGKKKVLVSPGIEPYGAFHLMLELYFGVRRRRK